MPTLGTQLISTSYPQLLKTFGIGGIDGTLQVVTDGDDTSSALQLSTTGVSSTGSMSVTGTATVGTLKVGASGPRLTAVSYGTAAFTSATVGAHNVSDATTGSFGLTGVALGDIVIGSLNSLGSATGTVNIGLSLYPAATNFVEYSIQNQGATAGTIPAGTFFATALRFIA
jgi:hypothetical protein